MALYSDGGSTSPDIYIVVVMDIIALISIFLNPFVFKYNCKKKRSIARDLYMALSLTDFLSSIILPFTTSVRILEPKEEKCQEGLGADNCRTKYYEYVRRATTGESVLGVVSWSLMFYPLIITSVLSMCRWYQIKFPLRPISRVTVEVVTMTTCMIKSVYFIVKLFNSPGETYMLTKIQNVWRRRFLIESEEEYNLIQFENLLSILLIFLSTAASILTVCNIVGTRPVPGSTRQQRRRKIISTVKIALLNLGGVMFVTSLVLSTVIDTWLTASTCFLPVLMSTYNPLIYTLLTEGVLTVNIRVGTVN